MRRRNTLPWLRRFFCGAGVVVFCALLAAPASARLAGPAAGDGVMIKWSCAARSDAGRFRLYRGADPRHLEVIAELPVHSGRRSYQQVDHGQRWLPWTYQLRYVDERGRERVLETVRWLPPTAAPTPLQDAAAPSAKALLPFAFESSLAAGAEAPHQDLRSAVDVWRPAPPVPPPRQEGFS